MGREPAPAPPLPSAFPRGGRAASEPQPLSPPHAGRARGPELEAEHPPSVSPRSRPGSHPPPRGSLWKLLCVGRVCGCVCPGLRPHPGQGRVARAGARGCPGSHTAGKPPRKPRPETRASGAGTRPRLAIPTPRWRGAPASPVTRETARAGSGRRLAVAVAQRTLFQGTRRRVPSPTSAAKGRGGHTATLGRSGASGGSSSLSRRAHRARSPPRAHAEPARTHRRPAHSHGHPGARALPADSYRTLARSVTAALRLPPAFARGPPHLLGAPPPSLFMGATWPPAWVEPSVSTGGGRARTGRTEDAWRGSKGVFGPCRGACTPRTLPLAAWRPCSAPPKRPWPERRPPPPLRRVVESE